MPCGLSHAHSSPSHHRYYNSSNAQEGQGQSHFIQQQTNNNMPQNPSQRNSDGPSSSSSSYPSSNILSPQVNSPQGQGQGPVSWIQLIQQSAWSRTWPPWSRIPFTPSWNEPFSSNLMYFSWVLFRNSICFALGVTTVVFLLTSLEAAMCHSWRYVRIFQWAVTVWITVFGVACALGLLGWFKFGIEGARSRTRTEAMGRSTNLFEQSQGLTNSIPFHSTTLEAQEQASLLEGLCQDCPPRSRSEARTQTWSIQGQGHNPHHHDCLDSQVPNPSPDPDCGTLHSNHPHPHSEETQESDRRNMTVQAACWTPTRNIPSNYNSRTPQGMESLRSRSNVNDTCLDGAPASSNPCSSGHGSHSHSTCRHRGNPMSPNPNPLRCPPMTTEENRSQDIYFGSPSDLGGQNNNSSGPCLWFTKD